MAIGRTSNHGTTERVVHATAMASSGDRSSTESNSDLAIDNFKMGCHEIIKNLEKFNQKKARDIDHCFFKLTENIPKEIVNAPINYCLNYYAEFCENEQQIEKEEATAPVSAAAATAAKTMPKKDDMQSVIDESVCDNKEQQQQKSTKATDQIDKG